jgi:hypothetical protein
MKKAFLLAIAVLLCQISGYAQVFEGIIKDAKTGENLEYVNVGVIGKDIAL